MVGQYRFATDEALFCNSGGTRSTVAVPIRWVMRKSFISKNKKITFTKYMNEMRRQKDKGQNTKNELNLLEKLAHTQI